MYMSTILWRVVSFWVNFVINHRFCENLVLCLNKDLKNKICFIKKMWYHNMKILWNIPNENSQWSWHWWHLILWVCLYILLYFLSTAVVYALMENLANSSGYFYISGLVIVIFLMHPVIRRNVQTLRIIWLSKNGRLGE